jgi:NHLM bacteriocin system ABC transporter peptidase/ATP-binding protein/NHLM bacteriocin system ABC transporter ATP-binding protein
METAECGAAALGIILEYHGRYVPLDLLRDDCGVSRDGSNAFYIKEAAKRYGLETKAFRRGVEGLVTRKPPFMVFWRWNHFLVVEGFARRKVYLNDPATGRRTIGIDEFERDYSGIAFTFEPGPAFVKQGQRPSAALGLLRRLATSKAALVFVILAGLALVIPNLAAAAFQRVFVDEILVEGHRDWLRPLLLAMALTAALRLAAAALEQTYLTRLEVRLALDEAVKFMSHILRFPVTFFQQRFTGDLVARAANTARIAKLISGELASTVVSLLTLVFYLAVMFPYDPFLALLGVGSGGMNLVTLRWFSRWRIDRNRTIEQVRARLAASVTWAIQIIEGVKATGSESELLVRWTGEQARMNNAEQGLGTYDAVLFVLPPFLATLTTIMVLGLGGRQVVVGGLSIGMLVAFQSLLSGFNQPFLNLARMSAQVQELRADLDRIEDVRHRAIDPVFASSSAVKPPSGAVAPQSSAAVPHRLSGHVEFRGLTFGYNRTVDEPLIKDFSLVAGPGQRIALVGSTGSGKSTIGRLAAGLYQPWSGEILYDGKPLARIAREVFVNSVALVDSEICLFEGSVRDNLTLWNELVYMDRLVNAGVDAAIHRDLLLRRGGYGAFVAEAGRNFSGGQRQRLQIARALVRDPSLLILDEATSALDPKTERIVDDNLRRRGCTCLIIAHRLTTIRDCDEIIVLNAGRVVERGTHDELIADAGGEYARLVSHQAVPGPRCGAVPRTRRRPPAQSADPVRSNFDESVSDRDTGSRAHPSDRFLDQESDAPRFIVEELGPYSESVRTAANLPLPLDDPEAVWWVSSGGVDVFFTQLEPGAPPESRRHLCRVEEGGSIFAISGIRGRSGGGLVAIGAGPAQLLKFARGDLIRLSFDEGLSEQVAVLIDDWVLRAGRALARLAGNHSREELRCSTIADLEAGTRFGVREGVAWIRHVRGTSLLFDRVPLPVTEHEARFPVTEHVWLTAASPCSVTACRTAEMIRAGDPWASLDDFHRTILDFISGIQESETRARLAEFRRSMAHESAVMESVSSRLAAAADETPIAAPFPEDDAFLRACRTVGQFLGIEVRAAHEAGAAGSEPSGDPLGDVARASGFHVRPVTLPVGWWRHGGSEPLLGRMANEENTPVAILPAKGGKRWFGPAYELVDREGRRRPIGLELAARIAPTAWVFYRSLPDRPLAMSDLFGFSLNLRNLSRELWMVLAMALVGAALGLAIPIAAGILVDQVIPTADLTRLSITCVFLVVLAISSAVFQAIQGLLLLRIEGRVSASLVPAVWDRLVRLPTRFFARFTSGDLAARALQFTAVFKRVSGAAVATIVTGLFSLANLGLLYYYSWRLALCTTVLLSIMLVITVLLLAGVLRQENAIRRVDGLIFGLLLELFDGIIALRSGGAEGRAFARWAAHYSDRLRLSISARRLSNRIHLWLAVYPIGGAMLIYLGIVHFDPITMRTGSFLAFSITFANVMAAILAVGYTSIGLLELLPTFERIKPILAERPEFTAAVIEPVRLGGALALNRVTFRYPGQDQSSKVLDDVSIQVRPGEFVAIVGPSGSGKSTLMRLLLGFETPDSGTVTYDGRELAALDLREVRRQIGVVLQQAELMPTDVFSNIVGFAPFLNMEDAWQAARLAGLEDDIRRMPMGMHTLVGEGGGNLSSGQRQRLLIARAIARRPKILLLDEATSALDNVTQSIISDSLTNRLKGTSRVVIAHRLDAIVASDRIYVLKESRIVQSGPYHQLMEEPGAFRDLARRQML